MVGTSALDFPGVRGAGLGLRRDFLDEIALGPAQPLDFLEVAPENWIGVGGRLGARFAEAAARYPLLCHGLSLSLGGPAPLDESLIAEVGRFLDRFGVCGYSEHLSYTSDGGQLYDLMPIPFTEAAADHVAERIRRVQRALGRTLVVENVSYYAAPGAEMTEIEFLNRVLETADCALLLDVNNVFVNAINHGYDAKGFIDALTPRRVAYIHIAGHYDQARDLKIDTHGAPVKAGVWDLLAHAYRRFGVLPTLLERDFNIPPLHELLTEVECIRVLQDCEGRQGLACG